MSNDIKEKRKSERKKITVATIIRKQTPSGNYSIMEFQSKDMSLGGVFISSEDLSIFDLGDEVEILVDDGGEKYYEGKARVVRSARILDKEGEQVESGFGLMFLNPSDEFKKMLENKLEHVSEGS